MKTIESSDDESLSEILRTWNVRVPLPPGFQEQVWRRIELAEIQSRATVWEIFVSWVQNALARPAIAIPYATALLALGLAGGYWHGKEASARVNATLGLRYVQSVDPYQTPPAIRP